ncbi:MAG: hypothetical protein HY540_02465 [Deltaproteobacteria bacterium]|nr:hypothetical protein [Deltaproteobacteria bacterium]
MPQKKKKASSSDFSHKDEQRYTNIILEQMRDHIQLIAEGQQQLRVELKEDIAAVNKHLGDEIRMTQLALTKTREGLEKKIDDVRTELKTEIQSVRTELKADIKRVEQTLSADIRRVVDKVEHHDEEIVFLKTAMAKRPTL